MVVKLKLDNEDWKKIVAKFDGKCVKCNGKINEGDEILWNLKSKEVKHVECPPSKSLKKEEGNDDDETDSGIVISEEADENIQRTAKYRGYSNYDEYNYGN